MRRELYGSRRCASSQEACTYVACRPSDTNRRTPSLRASPSRNQIRENSERSRVRLQALPQLVHGLRQARPRHATPPARSVCDQLPGPDRVVGGSDGARADVRDEDRQVVDVRPRSGPRRVGSALALEDHPRAQRVPDRRVAGAHDRRRADQQGREPADLRECGVGGVLGIGVVASCAPPTPGGSSARRPW